MKIRPIEDADWPRLQDFVRRHFGFSHIPDLRFHQHWFRSPFGDGWGGRLLERPDGSLAGALMVIALPGWFAGRETSLGYLSTGVVEDDARDRGMGAALYLWAYRSFPMVLAMSGNALSAPLNALMGQELPGTTLRRFLRLNHPDSLNLCRDQDRVGVTAPIGRASSPTAGITADWVDDVPADYDPLWHEVRDGLICTLDRSAAYLSWRCRAPYVDYRLLAIRSAHRLIGLAVCRPQETPAGPVFRITDTIARRDDAAVVWEAIAAATSDALFADFLVVGNTQDDALARAGFLESSVHGLEAVPHLLSPVEHRAWTGTFTLGGALPQADPSWRSVDAIYFTKGDGDRDWPTLYDLERLGVAAA